MTATRLEPAGPRLAPVGGTGSAALGASPKGRWFDSLDIGTLQRMGARAGGTHEPPCPQPDRMLAARLMAGESEALAEVYRQHAGVVFGVARRVLHNEAFAEDVTQEVFVYLWQFPDRFDATRGSLRSWLGLLAHHRSVDRVRAEKRRTDREDRSDPAISVDTEIDDYLAASWLSGRVRAALDKLPPDQREAVVLAYFGERTYRQVALELDLPEGTVKSRVRLALRRLDALLRPDFFDEEAPAWT